MIALAIPHCRQQQPPAWHAGFLDLLPAIRRHAWIAFRHLGEEAREEAVQAVLTNAMVAYCRLVELGKTDVAYASALARYGVAQVRAGRRVGGQLNVKDVSSVHCRLTKGVQVERLDRYDREQDGWREVLVEDKKAGPAQTAAMRVDFSDWLRTLGSKHRRIALTLAAGESTSAAARKFRLSPARISQLRRLLQDAWLAFQGEPAVA